MNPKKDLMSTWEPSFCLQFQGFLGLLLGTKTISPNPPCLSFPTVFPSPFPPDFRKFCGLCERGHVAPALHLIPLLTPRPLVLLQGTGRGKGPCLTATFPSGLPGTTAGNGVLWCWFRDGPGKEYKRECPEGGLHRLHLQGDSAGERQAPPCLLLLGHPLWSFSLGMDPPALRRKWNYALFI